MVEIHSLYEMKSDLSGTQWPLVRSSCNQLVQHLQEPCEQLQMGRKVYVRFNVQRIFGIGQAHLEPHLHGVQFPQLTFELTGIVF